MWRKSNGVAVWRSQFNLSRIILSILKISDEEQPQKLSLANTFSAGIFYPSKRNRKQMNSISGQKWTHFQYLFWQIKCKVIEKNSKIKWRSSSVVKSRGCSFWTQVQFPISTWRPTTVLTPRESNAVFWPLCSPGTHAYSTHTFRQNTNIHKIKINFKKIADVLKQAF